MPRIPVALAATALLAVACNKNAPVLPTDPGPPSVPSVVITITADTASLYAGSQTTITITARVQDGSAIPDNAPVTVNTNLGHFGLDGSGAPQKLMTATLTGGAATAKFYAGNETGTANLLAQIGTSVGRLNLAITQPPDAPVADFSYDVKDSRAFFIDQSTGSPSKRTWDFGDQTPTSDAANPTHDYKEPGIYTVTLTVEGIGGTSAKSRFVEIVGIPLPPLVASFQWRPADGLTVKFIDTSSGGPSAWEWDFGDNTDKSTAQNPNHTYKSPGPFAVSLKVTRGNDAATTRDFVTVSATPPIADFTYDTRGLQAIFHDSSFGAPTEWKWEFGDTKSSTDRNPTHDYERADTYKVTLTATNSVGSTQKSQFVKVPKDGPRASFTFDVHDFDATFQDTSTGTPTAWEWNFGDDTALDHRQNPTHRYAIAKTYTVSLKVSNAEGDSTVSQFVSIVVKPFAAFSYTFASQDKLTVSFVDRSNGNPTTWQWNFGDCAFQVDCTSSQQNPTHVYMSPGTYTVVLTASNTAGPDSESKTIQVGVP